MSMSPTVSVFKNAFLRRAALLSAIALFIGTVFPQQASAQLTFTPSAGGFQTGDNIANVGAPMWVDNLTPGIVGIYYVNHSDNKIVVDGVGTGLGHPQYVFNPQGLEITVLTGYFTDVGAAVIYPCGSSTCPTMLLDYIDPSQNLHFLTSTDMIHFTTDVIPSASALGIGNQSPYPVLVPGLYSPNNVTQPANCRGCAYVATIGNNDRLVYISTTFDGIHFSSVYSNGTAVSVWTTLSRPAMVHSPAFDDILIGFTSDGPFGPGTRVAMLGAISGTRWPIGYQRSDIHWGNSGRAGTGDFAGISLVEYNGNLWVFGQDTAASQYLKYMYASDGNSPLCCFQGAVFPGNIQERYSPSTIFFNNAIYWVKQDSASTGIAWGYAQ